MQIIQRAETHGDSIALSAADGTWTYRDLLTASEAIAAELLDGATDLAEARVAYLVEPGGWYVATMWGIWRAGGIAVPLALSHPTPELAHVIDDSQAAVVVATPALVDRVSELAASRGLRLIELAETPAAAADLPVINESRRALMVYTSGTTGRPKGAVHTHRSVRANIEVLIEAWEWTADDHTLLVLPLHHVHGLVNIVCCALWAGARVDALPRFDDAATYRAIADGGLTVFMAVPTVYARLTAIHEAASPDDRRRFSEACAAMRLQVCGSAALPVPTLERWREISGHTLLERYGMTEIGMGLSNPLHGERRPGHVGQPLPGVGIRLVDEAGQPVPDGEPGEIEVRGPNVFLEYWNRPDATAEVFRDGWFRTGDTALLADGSFRILGRNSVDILKVGGYKVSALEIEEVLRTHPDVADCAVVGLPDPDLGQIIAAAVIGSADPAELRGWAKQQMAAYKVPHVVRGVDDLPRNAMGKVTKPEVADLF